MLAEVVGPVPLEGFGQPQWLPVGRLVASALELFDVGERLRHYGPVAVKCFPVFGQDSECQAQCPRSQVGHALFAQHQKAPVLHHQPEALGALLMRPADVSLPVGKLPACRPPVQQRNPVPLILDDLQQLAACGAVAQIVLLFE